MRYFSLLLLLSFFWVSLPASAQNAPVKKTKVKKSRQKAAVAPAPVKSVVKSPTVPPAQTEASPVLTFERTPCYGTCPNYLMQVYADGRVAYEGRRDVPMVGKKDLTIPVAAVTDMLRQAQEANFDKLQSKYVGNTADLPSTIIAVRQPNGQLKTVLVTEGEPDNVKLLVASLTKQFDALAQLARIDR